MKDIIFEYFGTTLYIFNNNEFKVVIPVELFCISKFMVFGILDFQSKVNANDVNITIKNELVTIKFSI